MMMQKKGVSTAIFKWILATVAGVLIFMFFYRFAFQHVGISDTLQDRQLAEHLNDELDAFGIAESAHAPLSLFSERTVRFSCGSIGVGKHIRDFHKIIYGPSSVQTDELYAWTEEWDFPFSIADFYYLSHDRMRTVVIFDDASEDFVRRLRVPPGFQFATVHIRELDLATLSSYDYAFDTVNLIYLTPFQSLPSVLQAFRHARVHVVEVDLVSHDVHYHNTNLDTYYIGDEMLYGLFFAPEQYVCLHERAMDHLRRMSLLLEQRAQLLRTKTDDTFCSDKLFEMSRALRTFATLDDVAALYDYKDVLEEQNTVLTKHSCVSAF
jgi:hypothetical protein